MNKLLIAILSFGILFGSPAEARRRGRVSTDIKYVRVKPALAPRIVSDIEGTNRCDDACPGRLIRVYNPSRDIVQAVVRCLNDKRTDLMVILGPHEYASIDLYVRGGLRAGDCEINRWTRR